MTNTSITKKRFLAIAVLLTMTLLVQGLIGCGSQEKSTTSAAPSTSAAAVESSSSTTSSASGTASTQSATSSTSGAMSAKTESSSIPKSETAENGTSSQGSKPDDAAAPASSTKSAAEVQGFQALSQDPELPNGCEITSLASVLNFYDYPVSKTTLSDSYLDKAPVGQANFYREFVGDPRDADAYGCYSPVLVNAANSYLTSVGSSMSAIDITGASPKELYARVDAGVPVIVWATRYMEPGHYSVTWNVDGQNLTWYTPEHCLVLVGYDNDNGTVKLADPLVGDIVEYDMDIFETRYGELKDQAIIIQ